MSEAEEGERRERAEDNAGGVRVELGVRREFNENHPFPLVMRNEMGKAIKVVIANNMPYG